LKMVNKALSIL